MLRKLVGKIYRALSRPSSAKKFYEDYWRVDRGSYSEGFVPQTCELFDFESVLDAGCGSGKVVRLFMARGKNALGIELSSRAIQDNCPDLLEQGRVINGSLTALPFEDEKFDLVFSSEVLEHLSEADAVLAVKEMVRVARRHLFMTISLRPSQHHNAYHVTIKPRTWWEALFCMQGCVVRQDIVDKCQAKLPNASTREIIEAGPAKDIVGEMGWFIDGNVVDFKGEREPWFFAFDKCS